MFVMLLISVITQIPQLNLAKLFSLEREASSDPERQLLADNATGANPASYTRQVDDDDASLAASSAQHQQPIEPNDLILPGTSRY